jgi:hypothetical protein
VAYNTVLAGLNALLQQPRLAPLTRKLTTVESLAVYTTRVVPLNYEAGGEIVLGAAYTTAACAAYAVGQTEPWLLNALRGTAGQAVFSDTLVPFFAFGDPAARDLPPPPGPDPEDAAAATLRAAENVVRQQRRLAALRAVLIIYLVGS